MNSQNNCFEELVSSFKIMCSALERKAEFDLKQIEKECGEEFSSSVKSLRKFNEVVSGISETCSEVVNNNRIFESAIGINKTENVINLPYDMHSDVVKCINELFNMTPLGKKAHEDKLIDEKHELSVTELIKIYEKNARDVKDTESTIIEAKETI